MDRLNSGTTVRDIVRQIAQSPEHMQRFFNASEGATANRNAIGTLYRHILGRQPDPGGLDAMTNLANQQRAQRGRRSASSTHRNIRRRTATGAFLVPAA